MEKIYIVEVHQGDYDEFTHRSLKAFKTKASADFYKHKAECIFQKLNEFYEAKKEERFDGENEFILNRYCTYLDKSLKYKPANFTINTLNLV